MKKSLALLALVGATAAARASYDLMYIPNATGTAIQRFDPVNRVFLGSIAASNVYDVSANNSSSTVVGINTSNRALAFDRSTGEFKYMIGPTQAGGFSNSFGQFQTYSGTGFTRYNAETGDSLSSASIPGAATIIRLGEGSQGRILGLHTVPGGNISASFFSSTNTLLSTTGLLFGSFFPGTNVFTNTTTILSPSGDTYAFGARTTANSNIIYNVKMGATGTLFVSIDGFFLPGFANTGANNTFTVMAGHGGSFFVVGQDLSSSAVRIQHYAALGSSPTLITEYTTTSITVPTTQRWNAANIVAPEPGSMLALGAGLAFLAKRRRKVTA